MSNRHLNIFEPYSQHGEKKLPWENNLTRGLAIALQSDVYVFERFISFVGKKQSKYKSEPLLEAPYKGIEWGVDIQKAAKDIEPKYDKIIGVALTTKSESVSANIGKCERTIPDIKIECGKTLILVEAKRDDATAIEQSNGQIVELLKSYPISNIPKNEVISLTWEELMSELDDVNEWLRTERQENIILYDYLEYIKRYAPSFLPVEPIGRLKKDEHDRIDKRLERFQLNYDKIHRKDGAKKKTRSEGYWIQKSFSSRNYIREFLLAFDEEEGFYIRLAPGANLYQSMCLWDSVKDEIRGTGKIAFNGNDYEVRIRVELYSLDSYGRTQHNEFVEEESIQKEKYLKIAKALWGRKIRDEIETQKLFEGLKELGLPVDITDNFYRKFCDEVKIGNRFSPSLGLDIRIKISFDQMKRIDCVGFADNGNDILIAFSDGIIQEALRRIDGK